MLREYFLQVRCGVGLGLLVLCGCQNPAPPTDPIRAIAPVAGHIEEVLQGQARFWNLGDIDGFMTGYWRNENLTFSSGGTVERGWQATLDRFVERYPTTDNMGTLRFNNLEIWQLAENVALVLGEWDLSRKSEAGGNVGGNFSLVMKRIGPDWKIIHDHTSRLE